MRFISFINHLASKVLTKAHLFSFRSSKRNEKVLKNNPVKVMQVFLFNEQLFIS